LVKTVLSIIQTLVVSVTLFFLIRYTRETTKLRRIADKQLDLSLRPCLTIYLNPNPSITLKNIGHGPALDIFITPVVEDKFVYKFPRIHLLEPGKESISFPVTRHRNDPEQTLLSGQISVWEIRDKVTLEIFYGNLGGIRYYSIVKFDKSDWTIKLDRTGRI